MIPIHGQPPTWGPNPVAKDRVHKASDESSYDQVGHRLHTLCDCSGNDGTSDGAKNKLEDPKGELLWGEVLAEKVVVPDKRIARFTVGKGVAKCDFLALSS